MRRLGVVMLAAALLAALIPATAANAAAGLVVEQKFSADSGDSCRYGFTEGVLGWRLAPLPSYLVVDVKGVVADRPMLADPGKPCVDDVRHTVATFTAYAGKTLVDEQARKVDNELAEFSFTLGADLKVSAIDRVVIQVCRLSKLMPFDYCGPAREYQGPMVIL